MKAPPQDRPQDDPGARLCTISHDNAFILPIAIPELAHTAVPTLIDSGASDNFIDSSLVAEDPRLTPLNPPVLLTLFDGQRTSSGRITHAFPHTIVFPTGETRAIVSYVTTLHPAAKLVLGLSWLTAENPCIDFAARTVALRAQDEPRDPSDLDPTNLDPLTTPPVDITIERSPDCQSGLYECEGEDSDFDSDTEESETDPGEETAETDEPERTGPEEDEPNIAIIGAAAFALLQKQGVPAYCFAPVEFCKSMRAAQTTEEQRVLDENVPPQYHEFADVFSDKQAEELPPHRPHDHTIDIEEGTEPPHGPIYALSPRELEALRQYIDENLRKGFIRPSNSPAGAPILFAKKKDGSLRLCVDYRGLNKITRKNRYPLPLQGDLFDRLREAKIFSALDLRAGYNNIRIAPGHEWKTTFRTRYGSFEYLVMPFGLTNAPATFQKFMNELFHDMTDDFLVIYLDDLLIFSKDPTKHEEHVRLVMNRLRKHNLHVKPEKCKFHSDTVTYLGFIISPDGVAMDPEKTRAIRSWPAPRNQKETQRFLGFCNFYRRFIDHYSSIAAPLTDLTRNGRPFAWTEAADRAFTTLKAAFESAPILNHYQPERQIIVETDCSDYALGGILSQIDPGSGEIHPVAFHSRKLSPAEVNYDIYDKELLGVVDCFQAWRHYLEGAPERIEVVTDHRNLQHFKEKKTLNRRQVRWSQFLEEFDFVIRYRPGKLGEKPDALTRHAGVYPQNKGSAQERGGRRQEEYFFQPGRLMAGLILDFSILTSLIKEGTAHDEEAQRRMALIAPDDPRAALDESGQLLVGGKVFVPDYENLRLKITQAFHDHHLAGHPGIRRTTRRIRERYWWPKLGEYVENFVKSCEVCARTKAMRHKPYGPLRFLPVAERPWSSISMDFIEGLPESEGHDAILVVVDRLTKMGLFIPTRKDVDTPELVRIFTDRVFAKHGAPHDIVSDRGRHFVSKLWNGVCQALHIKSNLSTAYHPETDGQTERVNQILEQYLRVYSGYQQDDWCALLPLAEFAYNNTPHEATGLTPFFANKGYHPALSTDAVAELPAAARETVEDWRELQNFLREQLTKTIARYKVATAPRRAPAPAFEKGSKVWLDARNIHTKRPMKKLDNRRIGPFVVEEEVSTHARRLKLPPHLRFLHPVFHIHLLEPYVVNELTGRTQPPPPAVEVEGAEEFEVEEVLDSRFDRRRRAGEELIYTVKWIGHSDPTHEPEANLEHAPEKVHEYHTRYPDRPGPHNRPTRGPEHFEQQENQTPGPPPAGAPAGSRHGAVEPRYRFRTRR